MPRATLQASAGENGRAARRNGDGRCKVLDKVGIRSKEAGDVVPLVGGDEVVLREVQEQAEPAEDLVLDLEELDVDDVLLELRERDVVGVAPEVLLPDSARFQVLDDREGRDDGVGRVQALELLQVAPYRELEDLERVGHHRLAACDAQGSAQCLIQRVDERLHQHLVLGHAILDQLGLLREIGQDQISRLVQEPKIFLVRAAEKVFFRLDELD